MAAGTSHCDRADDHQFIQVLCIGELSHRRALDVAPTKYFVQVHLGDAACRLAGVVVVVRVNDQTTEHPLHLAFHLVEQLLELAGFNEIGDVVIGMKTSARRLQPLPDLDGNRRSLICVGWVHTGGS